MYRSSALFTELQKGYVLTQQRCGDGFSSRRPPDEKYICCCCRLPGRLGSAASAGRPKVLYSYSSSSESSSASLSQLTKGSAASRTFLPACSGLGWRWRTCSGYRVGGGGG